MHSDSATGGAAGPASNKENETPPRSGPTGEIAFIRYRGRMAEVTLPTLSSGIRRPHIQPGSRARFMKPEIGTR